MPAAPQLLSASLPRKPGFLQRWLQLPDAAGALALTEAAAALDAPLLVVCPDSSSAQQLVDELRFFAGDQLPVFSLPDWEVLPYDRFSPHQDIVSERLKTLLALPTQKQGLLVVPVTTLMQRLPPADFVASHALDLQPGQRLDLHGFRRQLEEAGYRNVDTVYEHGEFAVRGGLLDLFPMGCEQPIRIELFDDEIESLRFFNPETQRTEEKAERISLLPAHEFALTEAALKHFRTEFQTRFDVDLSRCDLYQDTLKGRVTPGLEFLMPLFFSHTATLFDYLPDASLIAEQGNIQQAASHYWDEIQRRYESLRHDVQHPCLAPTELYLPLEQLNRERNAFARIELHAGASDTSLSGDVTMPALPLPELAVAAKSPRPLGALQDFMAQHPEASILLTAESRGRREALLELLGRHDLQPVDVADWPAFVTERPRLALTLAPLDRGLYIQQPQLLLVTESILFGERIMQRRRRQTAAVNQELAFRSLTELTPGAPVVHIDHGVGRYMGLETLSAGGQTQEFLKLVYADNASLYVPVASLDRISRYSGTSDEVAPLHRLGSDQWDKQRRKAAEKIRDTAAELLDIYARREAQKGHAFTLDETAWEQFSAGFPFEETVDQQLAINAVIQDMCRTRPMDRVVCGDVGFGKTEVAMRAAFIAVHGQKQVAVLVPTTLLAQQHFENFRDRFADWPVNVELLSRFRSAKEQEVCIQRLEEGKVDILIGTHKLLQSSVKFQDLGLVIIDEEHRFGVRQKEQLKALRANVDLLSLTATPIPRTLNMAMSGIRDLSIIATPPARRLSVKTFVRQRDEAIIKEAVLRELLRGGQVYFLHNEVSTIENAAEKLRELIPEVRLGVAHGQMPERQLERVMQDFYHKRFNLLLCSTIIETGIDVPNANTIIIERADKFGLAQLHQLRGRVGRSHHQAYAYLLTPEGKKPTAEAEKRLEAIALNEDLGSGFVLASQDMEIRGAGELLGEEQSGQIESLGFSLYMDLLDEAVKAIRSGKTPNPDLPLQRGTEINLHLPALIPDDYLPDVNTRLQLYKRIASTRDKAGLKELQVEMIDRFGLLPDATKNLFRLTDLRHQAEAMGIQRIDAGKDKGVLHFSSQTRVEPIKLVQLVQRQPQVYRLDGAQALKFTRSMEDAEKCFTALQQLLDALA
ncbi:transcription-repair coupling factor [Marinospirillum alkaliphilum]|uniref:Transcription-repair-coupling factor n=1 Tax=Marinospirillum alkaliphilum DSM 21637 TaxID=1122209 RepID=A0A1K1U620_9GAMM|nr:transcription-repair coupling factor [Marinospirillum alkaliphilum]SFX08076.1 transcription-repair coupling factor [Marinospirillum alkaliphilum DSM 21637]